MPINFSMIRVKIQKYNQNWTVQANVLSMYVSDGSTIQCIQFYCCSCWYGDLGFCIACIM